MRKYLAHASRLAVTLAAIAAAILVGRGLWDHYQNEPWTRDARVRADVVSVAPDVSGLVSEVVVHDNDRVRKGDVLFRIDRARFEIALREAEAALQGREAALAQARRDRDRYLQLRDVVARKSAEQAETAVIQAEADERRALSERDLARLNLERSDVRASVNGIVTNLSLRPGDYLSAGKATLALVDTDSLHVEGYFEETKLPRIHVGDAVSIHLMGQSGQLHGRVASIAAAIEDRERSVGSGLLANINPTFTWVRLAQRVPVRIALTDAAPAGHLIAGQTATVSIEPANPAAAATAARAGTAG